MRWPMFYLVSLAPLAAAGCTTVVCGDGTIEKNGACEPAQETTNAGMCGSGTKLEGTQCVSIIQCDPATSMPVTDPATGQIKCVGISGMMDCSACPTPPDNSTTTICGQIYDFESNAAFADAAPTGKRCSAAPTTSGPCALHINAFDAIQFANNPTTAQPLPVKDMCIDDMGRFRLQQVAIPSGPLIGVGIDDANTANMGPGGITNSVGIAVSAFGGTTVSGVEHWVVHPSTSTAWMSSGGPPVSGGIYTGVFRAHACPAGTCTGDPFALQAGVTWVKPRGTPYYFTAAGTTRTMVDPVATMTGANGTAFLTGVSLADGFGFSGTGGITDTASCKWEAKPAAAIPNVVFIQLFHKISQAGKTCAE